MITMETLASTERWSPERLRQLKGHSVGSLMRNWATNVRRRWGDDAEAQIREALGEKANQLLPSEPTDQLWLPVYLQIQTTDIIIDQFLDGDPLALEELLWEDTEEARQSAAIKVLQWTGPGVLLRQAGQIHKRIYDIGELRADVKWGHATLTYQGAELFNNPTWQLIQLFAHRLLQRATNRTITRLTAHSPSPNSFQINIEWKR